MTTNELLEQIEDTMKDVHADAASGNNLYLLLSWCHTTIKCRDRELTHYKEQHPCTCYNHYNSVCKDD